jgi:hypothetical protein
MAQQIKKKFIQNDAVDGQKIKLQKDQSIRGQKQDGSEVELLKMDGSDKLVSGGQELAFKSQVDQEQSDRQGEVSRLEGLLSSEESERISGDEDLQSKLDSEESARIAGDASLQSQVDTEKGRVDAILLASDADKDSFAEIVQLINSVDTENDSAFGSYVLSNNAALASEVSSREQGDQDLQSNIDAEESRASDEESRIESKFDGMMASEEASRIAGDSAEQTRAMGIESSLQSQITQEVSDRQSAISSEESARQSADSSLQSSLNSEISDRQAAVSAEASARQAADSDLQSQHDDLDGYAQDVRSDLDDLDGYAQDVRSDLDQEIVDRAAAVSAEASARQSADSTEQAARIAGDSSTLQSSKDYTDGKISLVMSNLDTEALDSLVEVVTAFQNADSDLNQTISDLSSAATSALAAEQAARISGDESIQSNLDSEIARAEASEAAEQAARVAAVSDLQSSVDAEQSRAMGVESGLQSNKVSKSGDSIDGQLVITNEFDWGLIVNGGIKGNIHTIGESFGLDDFGLEGTFDGTLLKFTTRDGLLIRNTTGETMMGQNDHGFYFNNHENQSETYLDGGIISMLSASQPKMPTSAEHVAVKAYVDQQDSALSSRVTALEVQTDGPYFQKQKFVIDETSELSSIELSHECMENSLVVCVGRLMVHKDEDYSVSVVGGKSVLTWMGDFATGGSEAIEESDVIFVTFAREV